MGYIGKQNLKKSNRNVENSDNGGIIKAKVEDDSISLKINHQKIGEETVTDKATIHYSKTCTHLVPRREVK